MRYLSVCSGIEVAALAWVPLGWTPVLVSEVEAFPREVLRLRHGALDARRTRPVGGPALWGDFTALRMRHLRRLGIDPAGIDVLVGGTPCQGFSVAGLRGSLSDPRGGLSLAFLRLAHAIQSVRARARRPGLAVLWENVPGVLNTPDNALGCFLSALVGADDALRSPLQRGRWPSAGMVSGPRGRAAWRVLDAQHFGLAQRRERVFLVAGLGDGPDPAEVLFEPQGLRGHPAPRGEAAEDIAGTLAGGARSGGGYSTDDVPLTVGVLDTAGDRGGTLQDAVGGRPVSGALSCGDRGISPDQAAAGMIVPAYAAPVADTLRGHTRPGSNEVGTIVAHPLRAQHNASHRPDSDTYVPVLATALRARSGAKGPDSDATDCLLPVAFGGGQNCNQTELATALTAHPGGSRLDLETETFVIAPPIAFDCKAGGETGFSIGDLAGALRGEGHGGGHAAVAYSIRSDASREGSAKTPSVDAEGRVRLRDPGLGIGVEIAPTLDAGTPHGVSHTSGVRRLMPVECERLQGVPDHFTRIPWRGQPAELCPDGPRYRALGNAYPRPILAWLGARIATAAARPALAAAE